MTPGKSKTEKHSLNIWNVELEEGWSEDWISLMKDGCNVTDEWWQKDQKHTSNFSARVWRAESVRIQVGKCCKSLSIRYSLTDMQTWGLKVGILSVSWSDHLDFSSRFSSSPWHKPHLHPAEQQWSGRDPGVPDTGPMSRWQDLVPVQSGENWVFWLIQKKLATIFPHCHLLLPCFAQSTVRSSASSTPTPGFKFFLSSCRPALISHLMSDATAESAWSFQ